VLVHGPHDGRPANPQVTSDRGHRVGVLADPPAGLGAGPLGQHRPRTDRRRPLGPGPHLAGGLMTAPEALSPQQHHRAAATGQVAHPGPYGGRVGWPAPRSRCSRPRWPWSGRRAATRRLPPRRRGPQSHPGPAALRLTHYGVDPPGASCLADVTHPQAMRGPRCCSGGSTSPSATHRPRFMTKSPFTTVGHGLLSSALMRGRHGTDREKRSANPNSPGGLVSPRVAKGSETPS
jgi:hypothetical protein